MDTETVTMRPKSELPIWARLAFIDMISKVYFYDEARTKPRQAFEAVIVGFARTGDLVEIYYELPWPDEALGQTWHQYLWPTVKT